MGLAPFFDRARQSAAQVLRNFDVDMFERRLNEVTVTIAFDTIAATSAEGVAALDMAAHLAARLYPRIRVLPLDGDKALADGLIDTVRSINPSIEVVEKPAGEEVVLVAGATTAPANKAVYIGSDRWIANVSSTSPVGLGSSLIPFGAGAAACIGLANIFRFIFAEWLEKPELDQEICISMLNFATGADAANMDIDIGFDIGTVQLVGAGAIGNAFIWSMARLKHAVGTLHLIDPENVELTNLQRYIMTAMADDGASKVRLGAAAFSDSSLNVHAFSTDWAGYVAGQGHHHFNMVAVALDTARDRIQVQGALPKRIVNSWTQSGDLGISRHRFDDDNACLACLYLPTGQRRSEDAIIAEELGFVAEEVMAVRSMLHFGTPVDGHLSHQIASRLGIAPEILAPFVGLPLRAFRQKAICGNAVMRAADGGGVEIEVPMAFQSALAGVMLAAEVTASTSKTLSASSNTRVSVDLMRRIPARISFPMKKGSSGAVRCICQDEDYLSAYREKYSS